MAHTTFAPTYTHVAFAPIQPTTTETVTVGKGRALYITVGATSTTITITRYGTQFDTTANANKVYSGLTNTTVLVRLDEDTYKDPNSVGATVGTVGFNQVASVTMAEVVIPT